MTMSRNGNTGRSLGICKSWLVSATSMPSVISVSLMIAMISLYLFLVSDFGLSLLDHDESSIGRCVLYRNLEFHPSAILNLGKTYCEHPLSNFSCCIPHANCPTQGYQPAKLTV